MTGMSGYCDWIAVDWGTSHLRAWAMQGDKPRAEARSDAGMGTLDPTGFEPALLALVEPWMGAAPIEVLMCGMVGSRQGWAEAPYRPVPCTPLGPEHGRPATRDGRLRVRIVPGLKQAHPADVMRGEETQIAGFLATHANFDGVLCLPGTHTKWVQVSAGEVVSFRTFMTGEMFALLSRQSVLRHSVGAGWDDDAFDEAVGSTLARPETLAQRLFTIRAVGLLSGAEPGRATATLSGLLLGAELAASRPYWLGQRVAVVGATDPARSYVAALRLQGVDPEMADGDAMVLAGLVAARNMAQAPV